MKIEFPISIAHSVDCHELECVVALIDNVFSVIGKFLLNVVREAAFFSVRDPTRDSCLVELTILFRAFCYRLYSRLDLVRELGIF